MIGKLDVEEDVMDESIIANRKAAAVMKLYQVNCLMLLLLWGGIVMMMWW